MGIKSLLLATKPMNLHIENGTLVRDRTIVCVRMNVVILL